VFPKSSKRSSLKGGGPKVGDLPLDLLVQVRAREWKVKVRPKRLPHDLTWALHGGVLRKECFLNYDLGGLLLPQWFCV
jgi:hypothetical protein